MCMHYLGHFPPHSPIASRQNLFCPYLLILLKRKHKENKKDEAILLS
jgi:hypothetical protein